MDRILAVSEPVALVTLLATWLAVTIVGFTLVNYGVDGTTLAQAFSEAGSSVFTLGFTFSHSGGSRVVDFVAAGVGLVLVALQIAYLPTLYGAYNRRETLVTLLQSRAGSPAWGPELLIRHQLVGLIDNLPSLFAEWERWAADVAESHTTYPSLLYLRSPRPQNSWVVSLIAVMDAAALVLAVDPDGAPIEARMCIRMGFTCLRDIAEATRIPFDPDPSPDDPIQLPREEFDGAYRHLQAIGLPDVPAAGGGMAPLPRLAGQLRDRGLRAGHHPRRPAGPLDRAAHPVPRPRSSSRSDRSTVSPPPARAPVRHAGPDPGVPTGGSPSAARRRLHRSVPGVE